MSCVIEEKAPQPASRIDPAPPPGVRLVLAAQAGDRNALCTLFERHRRNVFATALRYMHDHGEAQELCQEIFLRVMRKIGQLSNPYCFAAWLHSIAERMALNRAARRRRDVSLSRQLAEQVSSPQGSPLGAVLANERRAQVRRALRKLSPLDRRTLLAFYFLGLSVRQMSRRFEVPEGTIKRRLHEARKRLARQLARLGLGTGKQAKPLARNDTHRAESAGRLGVPC